MDNKAMWEILVPTISNEGKPFRTRFHRAWDRKVEQIAGGLTVCPVVKGTWVAENGEVFKERMIPVRVLATREEIVKIAKIVMRDYNQKAVLAYKISNEPLMIGEGGIEA